MRYEDERMIAPKKEKEKRMSKKLKRFRFIVIMLVLIGILVGIVSCSLNSAASRNSDPDGKNGQSGDGLLSNLIKPAQKTSLSDKKKNPDIYSILVAGLDKERTNTDVLMIASFNTKTNQANIIQIPRDTYVKIGEKKFKFNSLYQVKDGIEGVCQEIYNNFGIEIDKYVTITLEGFRQIVDAIGGVEIDVPQDMDYEDPAQDLSIHIKKGVQKLNGEQAEGFVRYRRDYAMGDLKRVEVQKIFLAAFAKQLLSADNILKLPALLSTFISQAKTDVSITDALYFAKEASSIDLQKIGAYTLPGEATYLKGVSYYSVHKNNALTLINQFFNPYEEKISESDFKLPQITNEHEKVVESYEGNSFGEKNESDNEKDNPSETDNKTNGVLPGFENKIPSKYPTGPITITE